LRAEQLHRTRDLMNAAVLDSSSKLRGVAAVTRGARRRFAKAIARRPVPPDPHRKQRRPTLRGGLRVANEARTFG